jgi:hypothetical protein
MRLLARVGKGAACTYKAVRVPCIKRPVARRIRGRVRQKTAKAGFKSPGTIRRQLEPFYVMNAPLQWKT